MKSGLPPIKLNPGLSGLSKASSAVRFPPLKESKASSAVRFLPLKESKALSAVSPPPLEGPSALSVPIFQNNSKFNYNAPFNREKFNKHVQYLLRPPPDKSSPGEPSPGEPSPGEPSPGEPSLGALYAGLNVPPLPPALPDPIREKMRAQDIANEAFGRREALKEIKRRGEQRRAWAAEFGELDFLTGKPVQPPLPRYLHNLTIPPAARSLRPLPSSFKPPTDSLSEPPIPLTELYRGVLRREFPGARPGAGAANAATTAKAVATGKLRTKLSSVLGPSHIPIDPFKRNGSKRKGGYRATRRDKKYLKLYKQGKSIGFTMRASLKAKGLIPRANGTRRVSKKYK